MSRRVSAAKYRGLGDVVAAVAKPIARVIDHHLHTELAECSPCELRRQRLNQILPFPQKKPKNFDTHPPE
jgi:hypothetical protein